VQFWPAIDLIDGACVRLTKGDYGTKKIYSEDPVAVANSFLQQGADRIHVVDLNRAKDPTNHQMQVIAAICQQTPLKVQVGGGIRSFEDCGELIDLGVERVVIGSLAVKQPDLTNRILDKYPNTVLAMDVVEDLLGEFRVATNAWQQIEDGLRLEDLLDRYPNVQAILCTDIQRDGCLAGPNFELYENLKVRHPGIELLASGGVRDQRDMMRLSRIGVDGAVVGKALYEGRISIGEGLQC
jgi:phosphoribosylformimino-5-aminoimidazole carboxamide ribotide isomerase